MNNAQVRPARKRRMNKNYRIIKSWEREGNVSIIVSVGYNPGNLSLNTLKIGFDQRLMYAQPVDYEVSKPLCASPPPPPKA